MRGYRLGCVSFINTKPLIYGLDADPRVELHLDVPSRLLEGLLSGKFDAALLPVVDGLRTPGLRRVAASGIGSDGETLTVRIFSRCALDQVERLACDTDSHTSVALARVLLGERYGRRPEFVDLTDEAAGGADARLLIGDKVICEAPTDYPHQFDLGRMWKEMTGLPFVFAAWTARAETPLGDLADRLEQAKRVGLGHVDEIVATYAVPRGWPADVARRYLTENLCFDIGPRQVEAIGLFGRLCRAHGVLSSARADGGEQQGGGVSSTGAASTSSPAGSGSGAGWG